jgi:hypothetical protein
LAHHDLLGDDGMLAPDVRLISMGDHFDYDGERAEVGREGLAILRWLAEHPREQIPILAGNHDVCRVMELAPLDDRDFAEARVMAAELDAAKRRAQDVAEREQAFFERFPSVPSPGIVMRDFLSHGEAQRSLVQSLLLAGRMTLALTAQLPDGREAILTHAAITRRELALLSPASETPRDIATAQDWQPRSTRLVPTGWQVSVPGHSVWRRSMSRGLPARKEAASCTIVPRTPIVRAPTTPGNSTPMHRAASIRAGCLWGWSRCAAIRDIRNA